MSLINIINESFDKVLKESQNGKKKKILKESLVEDIDSGIEDLKRSVEEADDLYDIVEITDDLYSDFYEKAFKIVEREGFTDIQAEPSTQGLIGADFFWAKKDGVVYEGSYDYESEIDDIAGNVIDSNAKTYEELIDELAEWYATIILDNLEPSEDSLDEDLDESKQRGLYKLVRRDHNKTSSSYFISDDLNQLKDFQSNRLRNSKTGYGIVCNIRTFDKDANKYSYIDRPDYINCDLDTSGSIEDYKALHNVDLSPVSGYDHVFRVIK